MTSGALLVGLLVSQLGNAAGGRNYGDDQPARRPVGEIQAGDDAPAPRSGFNSKFLQDLEAEKNGVRAAADDAGAEEVLPTPNSKAAGRTAIDRGNINRGSADRTAVDRAAADRNNGTPAEGSRTTPLRTQPKAIASDSNDLSSPVRKADPVESMAVAFAMPNTNILPGEPLTLTVALSKRSDREGRLKIAHAFWKLSAATAAHGLAVGEHERLADLPKPERASDPDIDRDLWLSARATAQARVYETQLVAMTAQRDLAEAMGAAPNDALPVVNDRPYLGSYATRFDELFTTRTAPVKLRTIHETLPALQKAVAQRAEAAQTAQSALYRSEDRYTNGKYGISTYLSQFSYMSQQRQAFIAVARAYNDDIADYAISVARDGSTPAELASMMIRVRPTAEASRQQPAMRSADARGTASGQPSSAQFSTRQPTSTGDVPNSQSPGGFVPPTNENALRPGSSFSRNNGWSQRQ